MGKFKEGDKVRLKEGAVYPQNGEPWSNIDAKMIPGAVFEVSCTNKYSWKNIEYDCVGLKDNNAGYIPEDCFDFAEKTEKLEEGWYVPCNQDMEGNSELLEYRNHVRFSKECSWRDAGYINDKGWHCFKSELKNKRILTYQEFLDEIYNPWKSKQSAPIPLLLLPEKWYVKCTDNPNDTPELKEWRNSQWHLSGVICQDRMWNHLKYAEDTEISYDDFLKLVYNPWKAQQSITTLPEKWPELYVLCDKNCDSTLEWRKGATKHGDWCTTGTISETGYWKCREDAKGVELPYSTFIELVYKPWEATQTVTESTTVESPLPDKWAYTLQEDDLDVTFQWRQSQDIKSIYKSDKLQAGHIIAPKFHDKSGYLRFTSEENLKDKGYHFITKEQYYKYVIIPWKRTLSSKETSSTPKKEPFMPTDSIIVTSADVGAKVVKGRDWEWGNQDGINGIGTILGPSSEGWVNVKWNNGDKNSYRIGAGVKYDLYYLDSTSTIYDVQHLYEPKHSTTSYSTPDETPRLTIKKSKTKLLSTEVKELNVNLKLLKNN